MKKFTLNLSAALFLGMGVLMVSCGGGNKSSDENGTEQSSDMENKKGLNPETVQLKVFSQMPIKGDQADYFTIEEPESGTVTVTGTPDESYSSRGIVRCELNLRVNKKFNDKVYKLGGYNGLSMHFLDEDKEDIGEIYISNTDKELLEAELQKSNPGVVSVIFKDDVYESTYKKIFENARYVRLEDADITGVKEHEREMAMSERSERRSSGSSVDSDDSYELDDSEEKDSKFEKTKEKAQELKEKTKEKAKELTEKTKEKAQELKEKTKEKWNEIFD